MSIIYDFYLRSVFIDVVVAQMEAAGKQGRGRGPLDFAQSILLTRAIEHVDAAIEPPATPTCSPSPPFPRPCNPWNPLTSPSLLSTISATRITSGSFSALERPSDLMASQVQPSPMSSQLAKEPSSTLSFADFQDDDDFVFGASDDENEAAIQ